MKYFGILNDINAICLIIGNPLHYIHAPVEQQTERRGGRRREKNELGYCSLNTEHLFTLNKFNKF